MPDTGPPWEIPFLDGTELVRAYPAFSEDLAEQIAAGLSSAIPANAFVYAGTRYYTSSGTFEKADPLGTGDIGLKAIRVTVIGGGGGGGQGQSQGAAGGGGGGGAQSFITDIAGLSSSVSVDRGAGGSGGNDGGTSSFGTAVVAEGGERGSGASGGEYGSGTAGDLLLTGSSGGPGSRDGTIGGRAFSGSGGSSAFGYGGGGFGRTISSGSNESGNPGGLYGGGGSGAFGNQSGGAGANGIVVIDCFV